MSNAKVVYQQVLAGGEMANRVIQKADGTLIAQVRRGSDNRYIRATTRQAAALFRNALAVSMVQPGDKIMAWDSQISRFYLCTYMGRTAKNDAHEVRYDATVPETFQTQYVVPLEVARQDGIWGTKKGLRVEACINGEWVQATYIRYDEDTNRNLVLVDGQKKPQWATFIND